MFQTLSLNGGEENKTWFQIKQSVEKLYFGLYYSKQIEEAE
jgi:hypothetical protein